MQLLCHPFCTAHRSLGVAIKNSLFPANAAHIAASTAIERVSKRNIVSRVRSKMYDIFLHAPGLSPLIHHDILHGDKVRAICARAIHAQPHCTEKAPKSIRRQNIDYNTNKKHEICNLQQYLARLISAPQPIPGHVRFIPLIAATRHFFSLGFLLAGQPAAGS